MFEEPAILGGQDGFLKFQGDHVKAYRVSEAQGFNNFPVTRIDFCRRPVVDIGEILGKPRKIFFKIEVAGHEHSHYQN